ncbi:hypothetical protein [Streptomyces sp. UNOC14_S4]|uniref:hypothetical protein n=1 Tax=Streptomyces sp. UNOC14_S4 TaxID=2872340 RepID=UPI001E2873B1|nr:hypothetical protein [Streptomyces sp. UNOC14_S4]
MEPSSHARAVQWGAEQDLLRLLNGGGLGRELVSLTVAAGGGLSAHDFAELTGSRPRLVERELSTVSGRSFQWRSAHWVPGEPKIYVLAHEEVQRSAAELVTEVDLAGRELANTDPSHILQTWHYVHYGDSQIPF